MKRIVLILIAFSCLSKGYGQIEYRINNFPDGFFIRFIINSDQENEGFKAGNIIVFSNRVEFNFPIETVYKNPDFLLCKNNNELSFKNKDAAYKVYQTLSSGKIESVGIIVTINGKEYDLKGDISSLKGNLNNIPVLDNVVKK